MEKLSEAQVSCANSQRLQDIYRRADRYGARRFVRLCVQHGLNDVENFTFLLSLGDALKPKKTHKALIHAIYDGLGRDKSNYTIRCAEYRLLVRQLAGLILSDPSLLEALHSSAKSGCRPAELAYFCQEAFLELRLLLDIKTTDLPVILVNCDVVTESDSRRSDNKDNCGKHAPRMGTKKDDNDVGALASEIDTRAIGRLFASSAAKQAFGRVLRDLRLEAGLTLDSLSNLTGIRSNRLSEIECGKVNLTFDYVTRIVEPLQSIINTKEQDTANESQITENSPHM